MRWKRSIVRKLAAPTPKNIGCCSWTIGITESSAFPGAGRIRFDRTRGVDRSAAAGAPVQTVATDPSNAATLYAGTKGPNLTGQGIYKSTDAGDSWTLAPPPSQQRLR